MSFIEIQGEELDWLKKNIPMPQKYAARDALEDVQGNVRAFFRLVDAGGQDKYELVRGLAKIAAACERAAEELALV